MIKRSLMCCLYLVCALNFSAVAKSSDISFEHQGDVLSGIYLTPDDTSIERGVILFVHGDGDSPADAMGYYQPIWDKLLALGFAIVSWDKKGVGSSSGSWLKQSMQDRQSETLAAIDYVNKQLGYNIKQIGLMGFSQAGWVVPKVAQLRPNLGFVIGVGFAISWQQQSWYLTEQRLKAEEASAQQLAKARKEHIADFKLLASKPSYQDYLRANDYEGDLSPERYDFIVKNFRSDATQDYQNIRVPALFLFGEDDLNVDVRQSEKTIKSNVPTTTQLKLKVIKGASHQLLNSEDFDKQSFDFGMWLKLLWQGEDAYSPYFFSTLECWLDKAVAQ